MLETPIEINYMPELKEPTLIAGFGGWGNALDVSKAMVNYLIRKLEAQPFARLNADLFYRYDETRPIVDIEKGNLKSLSPPGGSFHFARSGHSEKDMVFLTADEPSLRWLHFASELFTLCEQLGVRRVITLGSMYDNVLHSDTVISALASSEELLAELDSRKVMPVSYRGPSAIHSTIQSEGKRRGIQCVSLWCHCPYYLQGTTHFGLLAELGSLLSQLGKFDLDTGELEASWKELNRQIQGLIERNPELQGMINELRKAKVRGSWETMKASTKKDEKIIHLSDFLKPK